MRWGQAGGRDSVCEDQMAWGLREGEEPEAVGTLWEGQASDLHPEPRKPTGSPSQEGPSHGELLPL